MQSSPHCVFLVAGAEMGPGRQCNGRPVRGPHRLTVIDVIAAMAARSWVQLRSFERAEQEQVMLNQLR